jgi:hypothetical protein
LRSPAGGSDIGLVTGAASGIGNAFAHVLPDGTASVLPFLPVQGRRQNMITWMKLGFAIALTLAATFAAARIMWRPLFAVLELVCQSAVATRFWSILTTVMLVCGPLFLVCFAAGQARGPAEFIRQAVYLCSLGLIGAFIMGVAVIRSVRQHVEPTPLPTPAAQLAE